MTRFVGGHDRAQERALTAYLEAHGARNCRRRPTVSARSGFIATARSTASITCDAIGSGPQTVSAFEFADLGGVMAFEDDSHNEVAGTGETGTCSGNVGEAPWTAADGSPAGRLYCLRFSNESSIQWTDRARHVGYFAVAADSAGPEALLTWWERYIRGPVVSRAAGMQGIAAGFDKAVQGGVSRCGPLQDPVADAALECGRTVPTADPGTYVDDLRIFHFHDAAGLDAFFRNYEAMFNAPVPRSDIGCDTGALVTSTYDRQGVTAGRRFCFPLNGLEVLLWTIDSSDTAVEIVRADQHLRALNRAWLALP